MSDRRDRFGSEIRRLSTPAPPSVASNARMALLLLRDGTVSEDSPFFHLERQSLGREPMRIVRRQGDFIKLLTRRRISAAFLPSWTMGTIRGRHCFRHHRPLHGGAGPSPGGWIDADRFFPAISTIQSRGRYFLFIPWLYQMLERDRIPAARADVHARWLQAKLVDSLKAGGEGIASGVIGIDAGANLQRPPSIAYWAGLRRLGILNYPGSTERYHTSLDAFYRDGHRAVRSEGEELIERAQHNWNANLPTAPVDLLTATTFDLRFEDAEFLTEQIRHDAGDSLLARCLAPSIRRVRSARAIWDLGGLDTLEDQLRNDIEDARRFAFSHGGRRTDLQPDARRG